MGADPDHRAYAHALSPDDHFFSLARIAQTPVPRKPATGCCTGNWGQLVAAGAEDRNTVIHKAFGAVGRRDAAHLDPLSARTVGSVGNDEIPEIRVDDKHIAWC